MIACPICSKPVDIQEKHYGTLYTCGHCRGVYFVGWDGTPEKQVVHEAEPEPPPAPPPKKKAKAPEPPPPAPEPEPVEEPEPEPEIVIEPVVFDSPVEDASGYEAPAEESPAAEPVYEAVAEEPAPAEEQPVTEEPVAEEAAPDFTAPMDSFAAGAPTETSGDFADVAAYANSEDPAQGPLSYTVRLRGLELAETFEKLREALTDSRFGWDAEVIMSEVHSGELTLKGMNPTKASILINRVKYLPIEIDWRQEVFGGV